MRVLHFGRFAHQLGGVERHAHQLCQQLAAMGVDVTNLVAASDRKNRTFVQGNYTIEEAASFGVAISTAMSPMLVWRAIQLHRAKPFDIFHLHFPDPLTHLASMLLPSNVPRVISWHSDIVKQKKLLKLYQPLLAHEVRRAQALVAGTHAHFECSQQIPASYPAVRKHIVPYGLSYEALARSPNHETLISCIKARAGSRPIVFALGRHVYYKGFEVLINALTQTEAYLVIGGDGPLRNSLERQAIRLGLQDRINFAGRIDDEMLPAFFHACDFFCLPSVEQSEAFGLVQLEAMSCGKPVICSQLNNGVNEANLHGYTGLAVTPNDPTELAHAINHLASRPDEVSRLAKNARRHACTQYSLKNMGENCISVYEDLLRPRTT